MGIMNIIFHLNNPDLLAFGSPTKNFGNATDLHHIVLSILQELNAKYINLSRMVPLAKKYHRISEFETSLLEENK